MANLTVQFLKQPLFSIGGTEVSLVSFAVVGMVILAAFVVSRWLRKYVLGQILDRYDVEPGLRFSLLRLSHYVVVAGGVLISLQVLGIGLTGLAVFSSLLGVGVGFGLQNVISNFVAGLIVLIERPIRVGDRIQVGATVGDVQAINMRSTIVRTLDNEFIIVPNDQFVSQQVINWRHKDPRIRIRIQIGVSYASKPRRIQEILTDVASQNTYVLKSPPPDARFVRFGDSSLDFELLIWLDRPDQQFKVESDLHYAIFDAFEEAGIEIPFPQRVVHMATESDS